MKTIPVKGRAAKRLFGYMLAYQETLAAEAGDVPHKSGTYRSITFGFSWHKRVELRSYYTATDGPHRRWTIEKGETGWDITLRMGGENFRFPPTKTLGEAKNFAEGVARRMPVHRLPKEGV